MNEDVKNSAELNESKKILEGEIVVPEQTHSKTLEVQTVEDVMENNFLRYSMSVIVDRALPDVRDCELGPYPLRRSQDAPQGARAGIWLFRRYGRCGEICAW